jgi:hypothetical protein
MKVSKVTGPGETQLVDVPKPTVGATDVLRQGQPRWVMSRRARSSRSALTSRASRWVTTS